MRLRVLAGPSLHQLAPIEANSDVPLYVSSEAFEGQIAVYIKGFEDENGKIGQSSYFERKERKGITWSIQVRGRFLQPRCSNDILFGNVFMRPLKLPWIFSAALRFMKYIDPSLAQDLASRSKPWALSPLIATMPHFAHQRIAEVTRPEPFPPSKPLVDDTRSLPIHHHKISGSSSKRRSHFQSSCNRNEVVFGPEDLVTTDFCYDFLHFSPDGIALRLPGGLSVDVLRYWDGQPVTFVCCERIPKGTTVDGNPWGKVFWCVVIEPADDNISVYEKAP